MTRGIFPNTDSGLLAWSFGFSNLINSDPELYGLSGAQAAQYAALHAQFAATMQASEPTVRSKTTTAAKNQARENLKNAARRLANLIYGTQSVTDAQKIQLGLTVRKSPTVAAIPDTVPRLSVQSVTGMTVKLRLNDRIVSSSRGKPAGVAGASIFSYVGIVPPGALSEWKFETNTGRTSMDLNFSTSLAPGTRVWVCAFWFNTRHQSGQVCPPVGTYIQGGAVAAA